MRPAVHKTAQKACSKLPTELLLRAPVRPPALQTAESSLAKCYARHAPNPGWISPGSTADGFVDANHPIRKKYDGFLEPQIFLSAMRKTVLAT